MTKTINFEITETEAEVLVLALDSILFSMTKYIAAQESLDRRLAEELGDRYHDLPLT